MKTILYHIIAGCIAILMGTGFSLLFNLQGEAILVRYYDGDTFIREEIQHPPATLFDKVGLAIFLAIMIYYCFHLWLDMNLKPVKETPNGCLDKDP